jgi:hypothetical protein
MRKNHSKKSAGGAGKRQSDIRISVIGKLAGSTLANKTIEDYLLKVVRALIDQRGVEALASLY